MYCVETNDGDFFDNMDVLKNAIEDSFVPGGMQQASDHYYVLEGEVNACNKKATTIFQNRCKEIDKDRSQLSLPLAIKGVTVKLMYTYGGSKDTQLSTYTFKENDPE